MANEKSSVQAGDEPPCPFCNSAPRHLRKLEGIYVEALICDACNFGLAPEKWRERTTALASPRATADVERVMMACLIALSIGYTQTNDDGDEVCADCDVDHASSEDHSPGCLVLRARAARAQLAAIATTKPGA